MIFNNGMSLFHGSYTSVEVISLDKCTRGKDFGKGFYLTSDPDQAKNFIKTSLKKAQRILSSEAIDFAIKQLMPEHLVDQYCFLTDRAIGCLDFQEARKYEV